MKKKLLSIVALTLVFVASASGASGDSTMERLQGVVNSVMIRAFPSALTDAVVRSAVLAVVDESQYQIEPEAALDPVFTATTCAHLVSNDLAERSPICDILLEASKDQYLFESDERWLSYVGVRGVPEHRKLVAVRDLIREWARQYLADPRRFRDLYVTLRPVLLVAWKDAETKARWRADVFRARARWFTLGFEYFVDPGHVALWQTYEKYVVARTAYRQRVSDTTGTLMLGGGWGLDSLAKAEMDALEAWHKHFEQVTQGAGVGARSENQWQMRMGYEFADRRYREGGQELVEAWLGAMRDLVSATAPTAEK